jgi:predicted dienelactone hydrolase
LKLPPFLLSHLNLARSHAYYQANLSPAEARYPVLVFSHGWVGMRVQNTYQVEELVSHGYIVFAPNHTYGAAFTVFPDGSVALNNPNALPSGVSDAEYASARQKLGQTWAGDIHFVIDQIERLERDEIPSPLASRMDLNRLGIFGHSTGGGAAVEACSSDPRCKAGLSMDAWLEPYFPPTPEQGLVKPFMFLESEKWNSGSRSQLFSALYDQPAGEHYLTIIQGARHYDFTDIPLLTPLAARLGL